MPGYYSLTANAELLPGTVVQALVEVEKASVLMDADPVILMQPCAVGAIDMLTQAEAGYFFRAIPKGMDVEQRCASWLVYIQPLPVSIP